MFQSLTIQSARLTLPALRHRVGLRPEAQMDGVQVDDVLHSILATVPVPR